MASENLSSINMSSGDKIAAFGNKQKAGYKTEFNQDGAKKDKQIINATKGVNLAKKKANSKKKAKIAKASKKKNKK
jgi:hypothetical protein